MKSKIRNRKTRRCTGAAAGFRQKVTGRANLINDIIKYSQKQPKTQSGTVQAARHDRNRIADRHSQEFRIFKNYPASAAPSSLEIEVGP